MSSTNRGAERATDDFYETPGWATRAMLRVLGPYTPTRVLDPGCGTGAIMREVVVHWPSVHTIVGVEIDEARARKVGVSHRTAASAVMAVHADFLAWDPMRAVLYPGPPTFDLAIGNPPFSHALPFAERCFMMARETVLLMRLAMLEGQGRAAWWRVHPADVFVLPKRPGFTADGKTDSTAYAWFRWGPGIGGRVSVLDLGDDVK